MEPNSNCSDRIIGDEVRDVSCDNLVLKSGDDLPEDIKPVENLKHFHLWLYRCTGEMDETSLPSFKGEITVFDLRQCQLNPFILPEMPKFEEMRMDTCIFPPITEETFKNVKNLKVIIFRSSPGTKIVPGCLKELSQLNNLIIQDQIVHHFTKDWLEGLASLQDLTLGHNDLEKIDEDTFENCTEITSLNINEPTLTKIEPNTFKPLTKLKQLNLLNSPLEEFTLDYFDEQVNLTSIGLPTKFLFEIGVDRLKEKFPDLEEIKIEEEDEDLDEMEVLKQRAKELDIRIQGRYICICPCPTECEYPSIDTPTMEEPEMI